MEVLKSFPNHDFLESSIITIGSYDGIHRGHYDIIRSMVNYSKALKIKSVLITFDPHPYHVIDDSKNKVSLLMGLDMKLKVLEKIGVDLIYIIPFTKSFSKTTADNFLDNFITPIFNPKYIIIGNDHHFGKDRSGNIKFLNKYCIKKNIILKIVKLVTDRGNKISSSNIRLLLENGFIRRANFELGYIYAFKGKVVKGNGRGKKLGFPTANIIPVEKYQLIPKNGVYFIRARIIGLITYGMCNFGCRPTFNESNFVLELHLFKDDLKDIYEKVIMVEFLERIRDEKKFTSPDKLISQLKNDKDKCIKLIDKYS